MIAGKKILSVVIARAGSQGIPLKNVRLLCGQPLVNWSIFASLASEFIDLTTISSNCEEVKDATASLLDKNIKWIQRPDEYSTPDSRNEDALIHAYYYAKEHFDFEADIIINLQPTSPIRHNDLIDRCIGEYAYYHFKEDYKADSLVTASYHTPFFWEIKEGELVSLWDVLHRKMRQEYEKDNELWMHDDGNIYLVEASKLIDRNCRIGEKPVMFMLDKLEALQIDEEIDFELIENILKLREMDSPI